MCTSIAILVVLYKRRLNESETINTLSNLDQASINLTVHIWDNSPEKLEDDQLDKLGTLPNASYTHHPENTALSKVYNTFCEQYSSANFVLILDQDTELPPEYLQTFLKSAKADVRRKCDVFIPTMICKNKIVSPGYFFAFKGFRKIKSSEGICRTRRFGMTIVGVGSGMFIRMSNNRLPVSFDNRLDFYGVDTKFFLDYSGTSRQIFVLPVHINHNTALLDRSNKQEYLKRRKILFDSWRIMFPLRSLKGLAVRAYIALLHARFYLW